jgi:hypothetical protein
MLRGKYDYLPDNTQQIKAWYEESGAMVELIIFGDSGHSIGCYADCDEYRSVISSFVENVCKNPSDTSADEVNRHNFLKKFGDLCPTKRDPESLAKPKGCTIF